MEKVLIIGGVAAGATAAAKIRRISSHVSITMLEAGPDISFANCGLPYYIGGDIKSRSKLILQSPESFRDQYQVEVHTHTLVTAIDRSKHLVKTVNTHNGEHQIFEYDKLILAQGGRPVTPDLPGAESSHVFTLWTLEDMDKISRHLEEKQPRHAVVVGGGFIGLEMVEALVKRGLHVSVVEMMPHVMSIMDAETAGFIQNEMLSYGVDIHTQAGVTEITAGSVLLNNGQSIQADMVILSIGVRPTLQLAMDAGLETGTSGGLKVDEYLRTSDESIYAAGDMIEIEHRILGKKVRIPLAGPANRQGRIAAGNVMGLKQKYSGAIGTSVVRVFEAVAGITGLSLKQARAAGIDADAVVVHKEHHTSYYPGAENVTVNLVYERKTGIILGGQTAGYKGADKRLDVIAMAIASKMTLEALAEVDFAYSPPIGTANDAMNMAAYTASNKKSGFSPSVTVSELDNLLAGKSAILVDVRDYFAYEKNHLGQALHIPLEMLATNQQNLSRDATILVYDETGKKGHQALRILKNAGFENVMNISGGYISLQRQARAVGFSQLNLTTDPVVQKSLEEKEIQEQEEKAANTPADTTPILVDVRTPMEFKGGAVPGAMNIPLDELQKRYQELGNNLNREITVYCASGARSAYAQNFLEQMGYTQVKNGGGINAMMAAQKSRKNNENQESPLIIDVRTPREFSGGAYPGAVNIPLDELPKHLNKLGSFTRDITVYCASGARSSYAMQYLSQQGFTNVKNGGGIMQMMMRK